MAVSRKDFLRTACVSGACLCGFSLIALSKDKSENNGDNTSISDDKKILIHEWISVLLSCLETNLEEEHLRKAIKETSIVHYKYLKMDETLATYAGDIDRFIGFIEKEWGWKIDFDKQSGILLANENKSYCVCPMVSMADGFGSYLMCNCSEGFAERMFSTVFGHPVKTEVVSSILRGYESCIYKITFPTKLDV
jgi:hypothetical protein